MRNEDILKNLQNSYENLQFFSIQNNMLTLNLNNENYAMPLINVNLGSINPNLFLMQPKEIYQVIYMLELLYKDTLTEFEGSFISHYMDNYLKIHEAFTSGDANYEFLDTMFGMPISISYDAYFQTKPGFALINDKINNYDSLMVSGKSNGKTLVLTNPNGFYKVDETPLLDDIRKYTNAGFTLFLLVAGTIVATCLYIIFFIFNH